MNQLFNKDDLAVTLAASQVRKNIANLEYSMDRLAGKVFQTAGTIRKVRKVFSFWKVLAVFGVIGAAVAYRQIRQSRS